MRLEKGGEGAHVGRDRHLVVVEDHDQVFFQVPRLVEPLEGEAGGERAVADHRHDLLVAADGVAGGGHAESGGDRGARVADIEAVVGALASLGKAADAVELAQGVKALAAAGEQLVGIGLVAHVPDDLVLGRVEHPVQGDGQLHHAQGAGEVAAGRRQRFR